MRLILEDYSAGRLNVVFTCTDGSQAIDETTGHHPDVALMDIAMPGMDGIETTRRLRALPRPPHVLILTSLSPSGTVERAIEAGAEGFVSKPTRRRKSSAASPTCAWACPSSIRPASDSSSTISILSSRNRAAMRRAPCLTLCPNGSARRWFLPPTGTPMPKSRNVCSFRNAPSRRTSHPRETDYAWAGYRWRVWLNVRICRTNYEAKDSTAVETPLRP